MNNGERRGKQTRYSEPEGVSYSEDQANGVALPHGLYGITGEQAPAGPRSESRIETAGVAPGLPTIHATINNSEG